jgi:hypothetical protein
MRRTWRRMRRRKRGMLTLSQVTISAWPDFLLVMAMMMFLSPVTHGVCVCRMHQSRLMAAPQSGVHPHSPFLHSLPIPSVLTDLLFPALDPLLPPFVGLNFTWLNGRSDQASDRWVRQGMTTIGEQFSSASLIRFGCLCVPEQRVMKRITDWQ